MSAVVLPSPLDIPQAPPDGFTQDEHQAIVSLLYACFTTAEGELNRRFEQECVGIVLTTPRYGERAERTGKDVSVYPVPTNQPYPEDITAGQLLEAPTGQTMATYESGMGFLSERWEEELDRRLSGWLHDQITAILGDEERAVALDAFDAYEMPWLLTAWLGAQEPRPIAPMIERWGPDVLEDACIAELDKHKRQAEQARLVAAMRERAEHAAALLAHLHGAPLPRFEMAQRTALECLCLRAVDHGLTAADVRAFATYAPQDLLSLRLRSHLAKWIFAPCRPRAHSTGGRRRCAIVWEATTTATCLTLATAARVALLSSSSRPSRPWGRWRRCYVGGRCFSSAAAPTWAGATGSRPRTSSPGASLACSSSTSSPRRSPPPPALRQAIYALTLLQPHASCVAAAVIDRAVGKWLETRSQNFPASYRGPLAIHAAARSSHGRNKIRSADLAAMVAASPFAEALGLLGIRKVDDLPFGQVVAVAEVVDVQPTDKLLGGLVPVGSVQYRLGDFGPGRLGIILERIQRVEPPIPAVGSQGLWPWYDAPPELLAQLRAS